MPQDFELGAATRQTTADRETASVTVRIPHDLKYLEGHFPGRPIVPGLAQLVLILDATHRAFGDLGAPKGMRRLKFTGPMDPGDELAVELERAVGGSDVKFVVRRGADKVTSGTLRF